MEKVVRFDGIINGEVFKWRTDLRSFDCHAEEVALWNKVLSGVKEETSGVEIGCLLGDSAHAILSCSPLIHLVSIDPIIPDSIESSLIGDAEVCIKKNEEFKDRFTFIQDYSYNVVSRFKDQSLDFVFIDGDHTYKGAIRDYNDWVPKIVKNGLLLIHDSRMSRIGGPNFHIGPPKVALEKVYRNSEQWELVGEAFSLTCARKKF